MEPFGQWASPALYSLIRTRFFDEFLLDSVRETGAKQIVLLAAGMDTRAFRLDWPAGTRLYELDHPEVLSAKDAIIADAGNEATCERRAIGADLADSSWPRMLLDAGYRQQEPSVWLIEGLLVYLSESAVRELLENVSSLAATGSYLGTDLVNSDTLISPMAWPVSANFARRGIPMRFGTNNPEKLLAGHGWQAEAVQSGERGAEYGRWPYPAVPRAFPGFPRSFLLKARRD